MAHQCVPKGWDLKKLNVFIVYIIKPIVFDMLRFYFINILFSDIFMLYSENNAHADPSKKHDVSFVFLKRSFGPKKSIIIPKICWVVAVGSIFQQIWKKWTASLMKVIYLLYNP